MPTENRSSNIEMVSVPRALVHVAVNGYVQEQGHALNELRELLLNTPLEGATHRYPGETNRSRQWRRQVAGVWCESLNGEWAPLDDAMVERYLPLEGVIQSDPVALAVPEECPHIIVFDDVDRANEHFCGTGARQAASRRFEQISQSWNAHLFVRVARNSRDDQYPSAMAVDPAEVERLTWEQIVALVNEVLGCEAHKWPVHDVGHQMTDINFNSLARIIDRVQRLRPAHAETAEVERLRASLETATHNVTEIQDQFEAAKAENDTLRAQLAEAQALLREAACHAIRMEPISASCLNRIDTALDRKS